MIWLQFVPFASLLFCAALLVYYRLNKKFKKERAKNWREFAEANIVEIIIAVMYIALAAPDWGALIFP